MEESQKYLDSFLASVQILPSFNLSFSFLFTLEQITLSF